MLAPGYPRLIAVVLATLLVDTAATTILIVDRRGRVLAGQGDCLRTDLKQLAALIAGTLQSSREVQVLTDRPSGELVITQGTRETLIGSALTGDSSLALMLPNDVPLTQATQRTQQAVQEVRTLLMDGRV